MAFLRTNLDNQRGAHKDRCPSKKGQCGFPCLNRVVDDLWSLWPSTSDASEGDSDSIPNLNEDRTWRAGRT